MRYLLPLLLLLPLVGCQATSEAMAEYNAALQTVQQDIAALAEAQANPEITQADLDALGAKLVASIAVAAEKAEALPDAAKSDVGALENLIKGISEGEGAGTTLLGGLLLWWMRNRRSEKLAAQGQHPVQLLTPTKAEKTTAAPASM